MAGGGIRSDPELGAALFTIAREAPVPSQPLRDDGIVEAVPELAALAATPQNPHWHPEGDVLVHSLWAADLAASYADERGVDPDWRAVLVLSALFHDLGKPDTTRERDGRITSYGHAEHGAELIRSMGRRLDLPRPLVKAAAAIAETHMAHVSVRGEPSPKAVRRARPTRGGRNLTRGLGGRRAVRRRGAWSGGEARRILAVAARRTGPRPLSERAVDHADLRRTISLIQIGA